MCYNYYKLFRYFISDLLLFLWWTCISSVLLIVNIVLNFGFQTPFMPISGSARSKTWVCNRSLAGDCGFDSRREHGYWFLVNVVCCHVQVSVSGWSLVRRGPTECGVSEYDHESSIMRRPCLTGGAVTPLLKISFF